MTTIDSLMPSNKQRNASAHTKKLDITTEFKRKSNQLVLLDYSPPCPSSRQPISPDIMSLLRSKKGGKSAKGESKKKEEEREVRVPGDNCLELFHWSQHATSLEDIIRHHELPQVVRLAPSSAALDVKQVHLRQPYLIYSSRHSSKVLASCLVWEADVKDYVKKGPPVLIPVNFQGWFELMPSGSKAAECYDSIGDIAELMPRKFLARTPINGFRRMVQNRSSAQEPRRHFIPPGETLTTVRPHVEYTKIDKKKSGLSRFFSRKQDYKEERFLQCTDDTGTNILIPYEEKGLFSPVGEAGTRSYDAVYKISDLVRGLDMPLEVQLVFGASPQEKEFSGILCLESVIHDHSAIVSTVNIHSRFRNVMEISLAFDLTFFRATNEEQSLKYDVVGDILRGCDASVDTFASSIKFVDECYRNAAQIYPKGDDQSILSETSNISALFSQLNAETQYDFVRLNAKTFVMQRKGNEMDEDGYMLPTEALEEISRTVSTSGSATQTSFSYQTRDEYTAVERVRRPQSRKAIKEQRRDSDGYRPSTSFKENFRLSVCSRVDEIEIDIDSGRSSGDSECHSRQASDELPPTTRRQSREFSPSKLSTGSNQDATEIIIDETDSYIISDDIARDYTTRYKRRSSKSRHAPPPPPRTSSVSSLNQKPTYATVNTSAIRMGRSTSTLSLIPQVPEPVVSPPARSVSTFDLAPAHSDAVRVDSTDSYFAKKASGGRGTPRKISSKRRSVTESKRGGSPESNGSSRATSPIPEHYQFVSPGSADSGVEVDAREDAGAFRTLPLPEDLSHLSVVDVSVALRYIGMREEVVLRFLQESIDGEFLKGLDISVLKEGFPELDSFESTKLVRFINGWRPKRSCTLIILSDAQLQARCIDSVC